MPRTRTRSRSGAGSRVSRSCRAADQEVRGERGDPRRVVEHATSAAAVRVSSSVRPCRERSPNSRTICERQPLADQLPRVPRRPVLAGQQRVHVRRVVQVRRHHRGQPLPGRSPSPIDVGDQVVRALAVRTGRARIAASSVRSEKAYDRLATNPARCAASCTESLNSSVLRSGPGSWPPVNSWVMATEARLARPAPRKRMPSSMPQAGHRSCFGGVDAIRSCRIVDRGPVIAAVAVPVRARGRAGGSGGHPGSSTCTLAAPGWPSRRPSTSSAVAAMSGRTRRLLRHRRPGRSSPGRLTSCLRVRLRGERRPAGPAAVPAVHRGQRLARHAAGRWSRVVRVGLPVPAERRARSLTAAEQPAQRPDPQVGLDVQERPGRVVRVRGPRQQRDEPRQGRGRRLRDCRSAAPQL